MKHSKKIGLLITFLLTSVYGYGEENYNNLTYIDSSFGVYNLSNAQIRFTQVSDEDTGKWENGYAPSKRLETNQIDSSGKFSSSIRLKAGPIKNLATFNYYLYSGSYGANSPITVSNTYKTSNFDLMPNTFAIPFDLLKFHYLQNNQLIFINHWDSDNWMASLQDEIYISELAIPGTHDTSTWKIYSSSAQTQYAKDDFTKQLKDGIRFFDIRVHVNANGDGWDLYHGPISLSATFDDLMTQVKPWMESHPKETLVMSIKNDGNDDNRMASIFDKYYNQYGKDALWYTDTSIPKLKDVRGKIVLAVRYPGSSKGWNLVGWPDNQTFTSTNGKFTFNVQDQWNPTSALDKSNAALDFMNKHKDDSGASTLNINFLSSSTFYCSWMPKVCAIATYDAFYKGYTTDLNKYSPQGIVALDFYDEAMVLSIIARNNKNLKP